MKEAMKRLSGMDPSDSMDEILKVVEDVLKNASDEDMDEALDLIAEKEEAARKYYLRPFDSDDIYNRLIEIHMKRNELHMVDHYRRCLDLKKARKWMILGDSYQLMGLNETAYKYLRRSLFFGPPDDLREDVESTLEKAEKRMEKAEKGLEKEMDKVKNDPGDPKSTVKAATYLLDLGKVDDALKVTNTALKSNKDDPDLLYRKGLALFGKDEFKKSMRIFKKLLEVKPNSTNYKRAFNLSRQMQDQDFLA